MKKFTKSLVVALISLVSCSEPSSVAPTNEGSGRIGAATYTCINPYDGSCTYGVLVIKQGACMKWKKDGVSGNALNWYWLAKEAGYSVGNVPKIGAIVVFEKNGVNGNAGHVGVVCEIDKNGVAYMWSMNDVDGLGKFTKRAVSAYASTKNKVPVIGYIYFNLDKNTWPKK